MDVKKIAELARLSLAEGEAKQLGEELSAVLGYIEKLKEVNVNGVPELTHPLETENTFRVNEVVKFPDEDVGALVGAAPEHHDGYVKVKKIFGE
jgi:aspartyl-tRNA(Asn)/glutamyl-tRNA(Gln) amidotransferase subunit C